MFLKPAPGLIVRDPNTRQPLPVEGREVQLTDWWARRLRAGDVMEVQATPASQWFRFPQSESDEVKS